LVAWQEEFEGRKRWLADRGIAYLLVLVPDKHMVYPEHLPWNVRRAAESTRARQLVEHLRTHSELPVLDLLPPLRAAKSEERLYNWTGTHWNEYGAWVAHREIAQQLGAAPASIDEFVVERRQERARRFLQLLRIRGDLSEEYIALRPRSPRQARQESGGARSENWRRRIPLSSIVMETGNAALPSAVVFHDSFVTVALEPFLSELFERVHYRWTYDFDPQLVESERPDIVIEERVGRSFLITEPSTADPAVLR
jgi:hypothetical protein